MHLIPKRKNEITVVKATKRICPMIVKNVEIDGLQTQTREGVFLEEEGEECGFYSKEDEVVPKVDDMSLVDGVFDDAFGGDGDEYFIIEEGVVVSSSS
ncbi:hypothetical protein Tco_0723760 [Tanacetum coccineum]